MIESVNNGKVKYWIKLKDKKYQNSENLFLVEGEHLVKEAYKKGVLQEVIALNGENYNYKNITYVSEKILKKVTTLSNRPKIIGVCKKLEPRGIKGNCILLDEIQDPGNMGTIIRSAVAFNIDTVVIGNNSVSIYNPKVIRASEGMIFHMNFIETNIEYLIPTLKENGYKVYSTNVKESKNVKDIKFGEKNAIIMGNEGNGVKPNISILADEYIHIKMNKNCESLNVGVATSIILYELSK